jgi:hypothetical protein
LDKVGSLEAAAPWGSAVWNNSLVSCSTVRSFMPHAQLMTFTKNIGMLLLAIFLIIYGLIAVFGFALGVVAGIIAILAGIFILLGR